MTFSPSRAPTSRMLARRARQAWAAFSRNYASQLRGKVHVYMRRFAPGSVLVDIELQKIDELFYLDLTLNI